MEVSNLNPSEGSIRIERLLPGPIERVWAYLTDSKLRSTWFAGGDMSGGAGSHVAFDMRHNRITTDEPSIEKYKQVHTEGISWQETILAMEAPRLLRFTWTGEDGRPSEVSFELSPEGEKVRLTLTHVRVSNREELADFGSGWHMHLNALANCLDGKQTTDFWSSWEALREHYGKLASAE
jgi:uncharacterized protein YndB with AHSA1/START domain